MRGQKLFWVHWNLFFKLLKHGHFWIKWPKMATIQHLSFTNKNNLKNWSFYAFRHKMKKHKKRNRVVSLQNRKNRKWKYLLFAPERLNQLRCGLVKHLKMTVWTSVPSMVGKKRPKMVAKWPFMSQFWIESVYKLHTNI